MNALRDRQGRTLDYLRLSVTDRCNLRCGYCMPEEGQALCSHNEILTFEEIERLTGIFAGLGVRKVRLTGGEPLVRRGVADLARKVSETRGIDFVGLTTNAVLLKDMALDLREAGVQAVNISLDSTNPVRYAALTRRNEFSRAFAGFRTALEVFPSVKVNCVLSPASAQEDWLGVVSLAKKYPVEVRLIEWMPISGEGGQGVSAETVLAKIAEAFGSLAEADAPEANCSASISQPGQHVQLFRVSGFAGRIGVIPSMSHPFCENCNRLRLTATGVLRLCLFYEGGLPLRPLLRSGAGDNEIADAIRCAALDKPEKHNGAVVGGNHQGMSRIGG